jgi:uncharacterized membrane protein YbhN (UPF0104 family)
LIRKIFNIIVFLSFGFLAYSLWKADYLKIPEIYSYKKITASIILLFAGTIAHSAQWFVILNSFNYKIKWNDSLISYGLSIFGKYIPGKVWSHMGRSAYVANKYNYPIKKITALSFLTQLISIGSGSLIGFIGFLFVSDYALLSILFLIFSILIGVFIVYPNIINKIFAFLNKTLPFKDIQINNLNKLQIYKTIPFFLVTIILYALGFYFLSASIMKNNIDYLTLFAFPIGMVMGIITVIFPGGLGVREGSIGSYLVIIGYSKPDAATIALFSRLWFLLGEIFIFLIAVIIKKITLKRN